MKFALDLTKKYYFHLFILYSLIIGLIRSFPTFWGKSDVAQFSDLLINYHAGFVRRGLMGDILIFLHDHVGINPIAVAMGLSFLSAITILMYFTRQFKKHGWNPILLLMGIIGTSICIYSPTFMRRDLIMMVLIMIPLMLFNRTSFTKWIFTSNILVIITILLHEVSFFYSVPLLVVIANLRIKNIIKSGLYFIPCCIAMFLVCIYKGTTEQCDIIIQTAQNVWTCDKPFGGFIGWIGKNPSDAYMMHIGRNFTEIYHYVPAFVVSIFSLIYVVWITTNAVPALYEGDKENLLSDFKLNYTPLLLLQIICMMPVFTILSCDYARLYMYCVIPSLVAYIEITHMNKTPILHPILLGWIEKSITKLNSVIKPRPGIIVICILFVGIQSCCGDWIDAFISSPIGSIVNNLEMFYSKVLLR